MAGDAHDGEFWLPVTSLVHYDDPSVGVGDEAWDPEALRASMAAEGQARAIEVGTSLHDVATRGDDTVACFNGNHRLAEARRLEWDVIRCVNSDADDAGPLTTGRILAMGGSLEDPGRVGDARAAQGVGREVWDGVGQAPRPGGARPGRAGPGRRKGE